MYFFIAVRHLHASEAAVMSAEYGHRVNQRRLESEIKSERTCCNSIDLRAAAGDKTLGIVAHTCAIMNSMTAVAMGAGGRARSRTNHFCRMIS